MTGPLRTTMPFPRTIAQTKAAPWCDDVDDDRRYGGAYIIIQVRYDWLPEKFRVSNACSTHGETFREALDRLRSDLWDWIRNPVTGEPISATPADWEAEGFALRVTPKQPS